MAKNSGRCCLWLSLTTTILLLRWVLAVCCVDSDAAGCTISGEFGPTRSTACHKTAAGHVFGVAAPSKARVEDETEHGAISFGQTVLAEYVSDVKFTAKDETSGVRSEHEFLTLLLNGLVYTPRPVGKRHILLAGTSVAAFFDDTEFPWASLVGFPGLNIIDVNGSVMVPGFIDVHVHISGGGGEVGPASRTPEACLSQLVNAGLTTVVGILGTDCVSRSLENLRVKAAALKDEGLTAYMWSGCYRVPSPTLTGSLIRDMMLIEEVVGAGEIAISDHRGSWPSTDDLLKLVSDARVGGLLSGKAGLLHAHIGQAPTMLDPLWELIKISKGAIPITQFLPTHISIRGSTLKEAAANWVGEGGRADLTSDQEGESATFQTLVDWGKRPDFALDRLSISSDGFGSLPKFDGSGKLLEYGIASPQANFKTVQRLVLEAGWPLERALQFSTINPATFLSLPRKGRLEVGADGDLLVMDAQQLELQYVFAKGQMMKSPSWTKRGLFER